MKVVYADTEALDVCKMGVVKSYEEAIEREEKNGVRVRALLIVNPHNPLGKIPPDSDSRSRVSWRVRLSSLLIPYVRTMLPARGAARTDGLLPEEKPSFHQ